MYTIDPCMTTTELALMRAKKIVEISDFLKSDMEFDDNMCSYHSHIYLAYKNYCRRHNLFVLPKIDLWRTLYDLGYSSLTVNNRFCWRGLVPKYVKVNAEEGAEDETND